MLRHKRMYAGGAEEGEGNEFMIQRFATCLDSFSVLRRCGTPIRQTDWSFVFTDEVSLRRLRFPRKGYSERLLNCTTPSRSLWKINRLGPRTFLPLVVVAYTF